MISHSVFGVVSVVVVVVVVSWLLLLSILIHVCWCQAGGSAFWVLCAFLIITLRRCRISSASYFSSAETTILGALILRMTQAERTTGQEIHIVKCKGHEQENETTETKKPNE